MGSFHFLITTTLTLLASFALLSHAHLSLKFYDATCPNMAAIVRATVQHAVSHEPRMAASLIRLHFHDCFVHGCDASLLLKETPTIKSEQNAPPNMNSVRGYEVIEAAKLKVERMCPGVVSCADILTLAARDASVAVGGPSWKVKLGRRDSTKAYYDLANKDLPPASLDLKGLIKAFKDKRLSIRDMVALSGAHTIGLSRCSLFRDHIYNNKTRIDPNFANMRKHQCPQTVGNGDNNVAPLDLETPDTLDNYYFKNLKRGRGLLNSDQVLFNGGSTDKIVNEYSKSPQAFAYDFGKAMVRMSEISPLLGNEGIIRKVCGAIN